MKKILGIGNALVDELMLITSTAVLNELHLPIGGMTLISDDAYDSLNTVRKEYPPQRATGGSAGNAIKAAAELGARCVFMGRVGEDETGRFYLDELKRTGIEDRLIHAQGRSGVASTFITPDGERTFATYLGVASELRAEDIPTNAFQDADIVHVEGYLVQNHALLSRIIEVARAGNARVSLDMASFNVVKENRDFLHDIVRDGVDILFANEEESKAFSREDDPEAALRHMAALCPIAIQKRGAQGSVAVSAAERVSVPGMKVKVVDTTGAGDYYAGGFLWSLVRGGTLKQCCQTGSILSANIIQHLGATLDTQTWDEIKLKVKEIMG